MNNKQISGIIKQAASLMALHDENSFKVKMYDSAAELIKNFNEPIEDIPADNLEAYDGIGKKIAAVILEILETGSFGQADELMANTPIGLIEVLNLKGIGPKKVRALWQELNVESLEDVVKVCQDGSVSNLKGFGAKTQEKVYGIALFKIANRGKLRYADAEAVALAIQERTDTEKEEMELVGEIVRGCDIVSNIQFLVDTNFDFKKLSFLAHIPKKSSPFVWRGQDHLTGIAVEVVKTENRAHERFALNASEDHLALEHEGGSLLRIARDNMDLSEEELYKKVGLPTMPLGVREGTWELKSDETKFKNLVTYEDLKGALHNHSVYSDGKNTVEEMALECKRLGYDYFGISDHSKTAFYANGLYEDKIEKQHKEIDEINAKYPDFKVFKGIESDILNDGALDYEDSVLASFDFIVASIHANLDMDMNKSMGRLITAIENPYTTMLGHVTGRLLLQRPEYPVNHKKIIDACAENKVIIELNANPWRLDMDWRHIDYALEKGVMIAINPDAHNLEGLLDMKYGTVCARKGGLTKDMCFNTKSAKEVEAYFDKKKSGKL